MLPLFELVNHPALKSFLMHYPNPAGQLTVYNQADENTDLAIELRRIERDLRHEKEKVTIRDRLQKRHENALQEAPEPEAAVRGRRVPYALQRSPTT